MSDLWLSLEEEKGLATVRHGAAMVAREMCDRGVIKKKILPHYWLQKSTWKWTDGLGLGKQVFRELKERERNLKNHLY